MTVADIIERVAAALGRMRDDGRTPGRLLIGHQEASELEAALYRQFPYPQIEDVKLFGVPVMRVDQPSLLGVIARLSEPDGEGEP